MSQLRSRKQVGKSPLNGEALALTGGPAIADSFLKGGQRGVLKVGTGVRKEGLRMLGSCWGRLLRTGGL